MSSIAETRVRGLARPAPGFLPLVFAATVLTSAALVFLVEPMVAKMVLPRLGGSPSVWNTSLAFFQAALLAGYGYAHLLQRIRSVRLQIVLHLIVLALAALSLPLRINPLLGETSTVAPELWLLGVLALSVGAPFAALSATAPLLQAWYSRTSARDAANPYVLYAASNLGSLLALLAYPLAVEPGLSLHDQAFGWSGGFLAFIALVATLGFSTRSRFAAQPTATAIRHEPASWGERLKWMSLSAVPSALMMACTTHISSDVAAVPLLWVLPLALYLSTFIFAFQAKPMIPAGGALLFQAAAAAACAAAMDPPVGLFLFNIILALTGFFLSALVCHQALAASRPAPAKLTDFYLWMSVGGVVGGGLCAFAAPLLFDNVYEYPLALALAGLARPWGRGPLQRREALALALGVGGAVGAVALAKTGHPALLKPVLGLAMIGAFLVRDRALAFAGMIGLVSAASLIISQGEHLLRSDRSFFGVSKITEMNGGGLGKLRLMVHGTTLHGAQAEAGPDHCTPLVYYGPLTPIGQAFDKTLAKGPNRRIGVVGMGAGSTAARTRPGDSLRFFEIDPVVIRLATDPSQFSFINGCARGKVDYVLGDARLTLQKEPAQSYDMLLIDAFSSDSIPAHLLTVEAMKIYLGKLKPGGVVVMHLSNRNLELKGPVAAVAHAAGAVAMEQIYLPKKGPSPMANSAEEAVVIARSPADLAAFAADPRWRPARERGSRTWTDDYTNVVGALIGRWKEPAGYVAR